LFFGSIRPRLSGRGAANREAPGPYSLAPARCETATSPEIACFTPARGGWHPEDETIEDNAAKVQYFRGEMNQNAKISAIMQFFASVQARQVKTVPKYYIFAGFCIIVIYSGQNSCIFATFSPKRSARRRGAKGGHRRRATI
jgi:hypothetical protein